MRRLLTISAVTLVLLAGCSDDDTTPTTTSTTAATTTTSPPGTTAATTTTSTTAATTTTSPPGTTAVEGIDPMEGAGTDPVSGEGTADPVALLTDVRTGRHEGFDRITFEFEEGSGRPDHVVQYVEPPILDDPVGEPVDVAGSAFLSINMTPASSADLSGAELRITYPGPARVPGNGTAELLEAVRTSDFEAVLTWVVGLADRVDFRVTTLDDPPRLVVDVRNH
jgi:hypothetical protein